MKFTLPFFKKKISPQKTTQENLTINQLFNYAVGGWKSKFLSDVYNEKILYPHDEMARAVKSYNTNGYIFASTNTLVDFITGGNISVKSDNPLTEQFLNSFIVTSGFKNYIHQMITDLVVTGNTYLEKIFSPDGKVIKYAYISYPQRMYISYDFTQDKIEFYVQQIPNVSPGNNVRMYTIKYYQNFKKSIQGIQFPTNKVLHLKLGVSNISIYGKGAVCVIINDVEINKEVERAIAVISRYKAIPKKLLMLDNPNPRALDDFKSQLSNLPDDSNPVTNVKVSALDLTGSQTNFDFQNISDYLKRKMTIVLAPEYIIHGEDSNRATAKEQRIGFILRVKSIRDVISTQIENELKNIASQNNLSPDNITFEFGSLDLGESEEKKSEAINGWNSGLLTLKEARQIYGLKNPSTVYDDNFKWELTTNQQSFGAIEPNSDNQGAEKEDNLR